MDRSGRTKHRCEASGRIPRSGEHALDASPAESGKPPDVTEHRCRPPYARPSPGRRCPDARASASAGKRRRRLRPRPSTARRRCSGAGRPQLGRDVRRRAARRPGGPGRRTRSSARPAASSTTRSTQAGIDRRAVYVTNAVKHFKWEPRGKRRIHAKPSWSELAACRPWLEAELAVVRPRVLVCLGATAAQALLGRQFRVTKQRGEWIESDLADT